MQTEQAGQQRSSRMRKRIKGNILILAVLLMILGTIIWILNITRILEGPWSGIMSAIFTVLGSLTALLQWHAQSTSLAPFLTTLPVPKASLSPILGESTIRPYTNARKGALIIHSRRSLQGTTVGLHRGFDVVDLQTHLASNVIEREENNRTTFTCIFHLLEPGNYTAHALAGQLIAQVTISHGQVAEIDWR